MAGLERSDRRAGNLEFKVYEKGGIIAYALGRVASQLMQRATLE